MKRGIKLNATVTIGQSGVVGAKIAPMPGYQKGRTAKQRIMREVAAANAAGVPSPTLERLGELIQDPPLHWTSVAEHVNTLISGGMLRREGRRLYLTDCGKTALDIFMLS